MRRTQRTSTRFRDGSSRATTARGAHRRGLPPCPRTRPRLPPGLRQEPAVPSISSGKATAPAEEVEGARLLSFMTPDLRPRRSSPSSVPGPVSVFAEGATPEARAPVREGRGEPRRGLAGHSARRGTLLTKFPTGSEQSIDVDAWSSVGAPCAREPVAHHLGRGSRRVVTSEEVHVPAHGGHGHARAPEGVGSAGPANERPGLAFPQKMAIRPLLTMSPGSGSARSKRSPGAAPFRRRKRSGSPTCHQPHPVARVVGGTGGSRPPTIQDFRTTGGMTVAYKNDFLAPGQGAQAW